MQKYHKKYPDYNFIQNKGYGTKAHFAAIKKFGPCPIHRKSFYPINLA
jgi:ribonuclease HII